MEQLFLGSWSGQTELEDRSIELSQTEMEKKLKI